MKLLVGCSDLLDGQAEAYFSDAEENAWSADMLTMDIDIPFNCRL